jgi:selenophosphate synthase
MCKSIGGQPNDWLFNSIYFGDETRDDRGKYEVMVTIYNVLTCDNILPILDLATKYGYRKNLYRIQR